MLIRGSAIVDIAAIRVLLAVSHRMIRRDHRTVRSSLDLTFANAIDWIRRSLDPTDGYPRIDCGPVVRLRRTRCILLATVSKEFDERTRTMGSVDLELLSEWAGLAVG